MESVVDQSSQLGAKQYPKITDKTIEYGTAGFRAKATDLPHLMYRMGLLAVLRSKIKKAIIGVIITASHNPEQDNGVKLIDPMGEMLEVSWEKLATELANAEDETLADTLESIIRRVNADMTIHAHVILGRDTRPTSVALCTAVKDGAEVMGATVEDFGLLTTPQLHYLVRCKNTGGLYGVPTEQGYYEKLGRSFSSLNSQPAVKELMNYASKLKVDTANGIGAPKLKEMVKLLGALLQIDICNDGSGKLNHECGADYVKINQKAPEGISQTSGVRLVSFDGDADRIVFYYFDKEGTFYLLDGDKIGTLIAGYLQELVSRSGMHVNLGLVQTAYSNGNSTQYITDNLKIPVACVPTGVKHLHHKAQDYDIGVYFEANGHGTVLFSDHVTNLIDKAVTDVGLSDSQKHASHRLRNLIDLTNQTVGDAISDLLVVETILHARDWSIADWNKCYTDLPSRQLKVKVKDRAVIQTTDAERKAVSPSGLQTAIDSLVLKYTSGRSFVRPSGTEDIVRVYAEADTQESADYLGYEVSVQVYELAGGVGDKPEPPQ